MSDYYSIPSIFKSLPVEAFIYRAKKSERAIFFILKGLYSRHDPERVASWERELIDARNDNNTFVCINTARLPIDDRTGESSFLEKKFEEECGDIKDIFEYLLEKGIISKQIPIFFIAYSFGGTTLLGVPEILERSSGIILVASGCGRDEKTTKPLLQSLFAEEKLLAPLRTYPGIFVYIRGTNDVVVPKESQDKIIKTVVSARVHIVFEILNAEHNLTFNNKEETQNRLSVLISALDNVITLNALTLSP